MKSDLLQPVAMSSPQKSSSPQIIVQHMHAKYCLETKQNLGYWNKQKPSTDIQVLPRRWSDTVYCYIAIYISKLQLGASMQSFLCAVQNEVGSAPLTFISKAPLKVRLWKHTRNGKNTESKWEGYKPKTPNQEKVALLRLF